MRTCMPPNLLQTLLGLFDSSTLPSKSWVPDFVDILRDTRARSKTMEVPRLVPSDPRGRMCLETVRTSLLQSCKHGVASKASHELCDLSASYHLLKTIFPFFKVGRLFRIVTRTL